MTDWNPFNVNEVVRVQLTDIGRAAHKAYWEPFSGGKYQPAKTDEDGWSEFQLWDLMALFGPKMTMGMSVPFSTNIEFKTASPPSRALSPETVSMISRMRAALDKAQDIGTERVLFGRSGPGLVLSDLRTLLNILKPEGEANG